MERRLLTRSTMLSRFAVSAVLCLALASCAGRTGAVRHAAQVAAPGPRELAELWIDPGSEPRDLFWGVGGEQLAPAAADSYRLDSRRDSGFSISYDVTASDGTGWSVKVGPEAQTEVVMSRLLWGLGYHQPPVYFLSSWHFTSR